MSAITKPVTALLGVLAVLVAGLFFATSSQAYPIGVASTCEVSDTTPPVGGSVSASCQHFQPGETVSITLHSATYSLGSATANGAGSFSTSVSLPSGVSGSHDLVFTGLSSGAQVSIGLDIGGSSSSGGSGSGSGTSGNLSGTGVAVVGIGALGLVLLVGGGLLLMAGRRRKVSA